VARIVVTSNCYLGDVAPFVAPANELVARGHDVTFLTASGFHRMLEGERFALDTYPLDFSAAAMHADPEHQKLMRHPWRNQIRLPRYWMRKALVDDPDKVRLGLLRSIEGADVLVTHATVGSAVIPIADHVGIPSVVGQFFPMMVPTAEHSAPMTARSLKLPRFVNRISWASTMRMTSTLFYDNEVTAFRRELGLGPQYAAAFSTWMDAAKTVMLVSRHYFGDAPTDWPPMTWGGFSMWAGPSGQALDPAVNEFLDAGEPPALVTMGTSAATSAGQRFAALGLGLDRIGLRSIHLVADERNLAPLRGREGVFVFAPIMSVLPRCRIAVVSGALGALASALTLGVPVVVVPQLFDQLWHGHQVEKLGVGIMAHSPRGVIKAVTRIENDPAYRERTQALAVKMAREDGAIALANAVESVL
jgi:UDP:flavonoid glycosyltransferase YjiC (YdhE family)